MNMNKKEMRFSLQSQMHEQYAENYNAHVNSFLTLLTAFFAMFGTLGYVYVHTENVWGFSMPSEDAFTLHHYAMISIFASAVFCFFSHLCAMFGYIERRDQIMNRYIREEYGFPVVYEDPRRRSLFDYLPEFYMAFYVLFLLSQIVLFVVFYVRTNVVDSCACQSFCAQNVCLYYALKAILFLMSIASWLFYYYQKLKKINYMPTVKEVLEKEKKKGGSEILLFEEGLSFKAYETSAYVLIEKYKFKPIVRYVESVDQIVVFVSFPVLSLKKYFTNFNRDGYLVTVSLKEPKVADEDYENWKEKLIAEMQETMKSSLREEMLSFPLENSSPMQCVAFLSDLKQRIHADEL